MRRLITLTLVFILCFSGTTPTLKDVKISNDVFSVNYSESLEQPLEVNYTVACTETVFSRAGLDFVPYKGVKTSDNDDYANNPYDKGHMAPAADFACDKAKLAATFSYLNCALQQENLNRGVWRLLEAAERDLAKKETVKVKIILHFSAKSVKLPTGATVPDGFTKKITHGKVTDTYYFENVKPAKKSYLEYKK